MDKVQPYIPNSLESFKCQNYGRHEVDVQGKCLQETW